MKMNIAVNEIEVVVMNSNQQVIKTFVDFDSYEYAEEFAKEEASWRGTPVQVTLHTSLGTLYSKTF